MQTSFCSSLFAIVSTSSTTTYCIYTRMALLISSRCPKAQEWNCLKLILLKFPSAFRSHHPTSHFAAPATIHVSCSIWRFVCPKHLVMKQCRCVVQGRSRSRLRCATSAQSGIGGKSAMAAPSRDTY